MQENTDQKKLSIWALSTQWLFSLPTWQFLLYKSMDWFLNDRNLRHEIACHHPPSRNNEGMGESDETSRIVCGHVNFPEMNGGISVYGGQSRIIISVYFSYQNTLQK